MDKTDWHLPEANEGIFTPDTYHQVRQWESACRTEGEANPGLSSETETVTWKGCLPCCLPHFGFPIDSAAATEESGLTKKKILFLTEENPTSVIKAVQQDTIQIACRKILVSPTRRSE